jgi:hypothetical protein
MTLENCIPWEGGKVQQQIENVIKKLSQHDGIAGYTPPPTRILA